MKTRFMRLSLLVALLVSTFGIVTSITQAQQNLLLNPSFDQAGTPRSGFDGSTPIGWEPWSAGYTLLSDTDAFPAHVRSAPYSWIIRRDYAEFTGGGYQGVNVEANKTYQLTVYSYIWTCNDTTGSCITGDGTFSQPESGGKVRIGLDPNGGTDPNSPNIIWSAFATPHQQVVWQQLSVSAKATGTRMTAWLYFNSTTPMRWQEVHFDDAQMIEVGGTGITAPVTGTGTPVANNAAPPPQFVPFVTAQQPRPDGSLVHVVVSGDTINSILVAYRDLGITSDILTRANQWRFPPQFIGIGDELIILPPGSLDPNTGALTPAGQAFIEGGEVPAAAPPAAAATQPVVQEVPAGVTPTAVVVQVVPTDITPTAVVVQAVTPETPAATPAAPVAADGVGVVQPIDTFLPVGSIPH